MNRYTRVLPILLCFLWGQSLPSLAQTSPITELTPSNRISLIKELVEAIGAAGDALTKLTDSVKHLVVTGVEGYDAASARLTYSDLVNLTKAATELTIGNAQAADALESYVRLPVDSNWRFVVKRLERTLGQVNALLTRIRQEKSDFVLEPAYEKLNATLQARVSLLNQLKSMPPPKTEEELDLLREANIKYKRLIEQLRAARDELNQYIKQHKPD